MRNTQRTWLLGSIIALLLTIYMNVPSWYVLMTVPGASTIHMGQTDNDRAYYLSRIKEAAEGKTFIGNSALYEHRNDTSPNGFIEWLTAIPMRMTHIDLGHAIAITDFLFPFIILLLTFLWTERLLGSRLAAAATVIAIWSLLFSPFGLTRESSPKATMIILSLYLAVLFCMDENRWQRVLRGVLIGLMMYSYHYHWTVLFVFEGLIILHDLFIRKISLRKVIASALWVWAPLVIIAIPYGIRLIQYSGNPIAADMWRRFGMIPKHLPTAPVLQWVTILWLAAIGTVQLTGLRRDRRLLLLFLLLIAGFIALNSNIITGREAEFEGHYGRIIRLFTWTALFLCLSLGMNQKRYAILCSLFIAISAITALHDLPPIIASSIDNERIWQSSDKQQVMDWLSAHTSNESVVLAPYSLASIIPVFTDDYVFMNYAARSFFVSDEELLQRYMVQTTFFPEDREPISSGIQSVFGNYPGSLYSNTKRFYQLTHFFKPFTKTIPDFITDQEKRQRIEKHLQIPDMAAVKEYITRYRLDYLITQEPIPETLKSLFTKVDTVGAYTIYHSQTHS